MKANHPTKLLVITGPTATGKTRLAAHLANRLQGEVISADSRQVYRGMDLGTGKDLEDFIIDGTRIPFHLIDIVDPGYEYNVFEFQKDFINAYQHVISQHKRAILCGGTGLYVEAAISGYRLQQVPENMDLRQQLSTLSMAELTDILRRMRSLHNTTDITDRQRLIRAIEIETYQQKNREIINDYPDFQSRVFAIHFPRKVIRERITRRLEQRLEEGMVAEVETLLTKGIKPETLTFYGLEYRYITRYIMGKIDYGTMFQQLNTAIHQFAKRQMTWFRRMERKGTPIYWLDGQKPLEQNVQEVIRNQ